MLLAAPFASGSTVSLEARGCLSLACAPDRTEGTRSATGVALLNTLIRMRRNRGDAASKAKEREKAKAELAKKAGVPSTFQWPKEKKDIPLESSGNKEVDEGDGDDKVAGFHVPLF